MRIQLLCLLLVAGYGFAPMHGLADPPDAAIQIILTQSDLSLPQSVQSDIEDLLKKATGLTTAFTRKETNKAQFTIRLHLSPTLAQDGNTETFQLKNTGAKTLDITGASSEAIQAACYWWLENLGFRFLLPGDDWTIVPKISSPIPEVNTTVTPAFRERIMFSTYGQMPPSQMGLSYDIRDDWNLWQDRLRLGGQLHIETGHYGATFNRKYKEVLSKHPEYRPEIKDKRKPYSEQMKLNFAHEEVIQLYIQDALDRLAEKEKAKAPRPWFVNIEPSDGEGWCTCVECKKLGSTSNVVYNLANRVAEAIEGKYPGSNVYLLAYGSHAATPTFALRANVFVMTTPYWFQEVGSPEKFMTDWAAKATDKGIRLYWNMPTGLDVDIPRFNALNDAPHILQLAQKHGYEAFVCQSSFGAGSSGFLQYLTSRLLWQPDANARNVLDDFCRAAFGADAATPMSELFTLWNTRFNVDTDLPLVHQYLAEAGRMTKDAGVQKRLDDLKIYVHYLSLLADYRRNEADDTVRKALIDYAWSINHTRMVNAYLVSMHLLKKKKADLDETTFGQAFRKNGGTGTVRSITRSAAVALFEKDEAVLKSSPTSEVSAARRSMEKLAADAAQAWRPITAVLPGLDAENTDVYWRFNADATFKALIEKGNSLKLNISVSDLVAKSICTVSILDARGEVVFEENIGKDGQTERLISPTLSPGVYTVNVRAKLCKVALQNPALPFVSIKPIRAGGFAEMTRYYFVLPPDRKAFSIRFQQKTKNTTVWVGDKKLRDVATGAAPEVINFYAQPSSKMQVGYVETKSSLFEFLDLPHVLALTPGQLLLAP